MARIITRSKLHMAAVCFTGLALAAGTVALAHYLACQPSETRPANNLVAAAPEASAGAEANAGRQPLPADGPGHVPPTEMLRRALERLHNEATTRFLLSDGNGQRRMVILPEKVKSEWKIPWWSPGELVEQPPVENNIDLAKIHDESRRDFNHEKTPPPPNVRFVGDAILLKDALQKLKHKDWDIKTLDLVGLVKHEHAVVYLSEKLPQMKELKDTPTRLLDFFEIAGLEELAKGENLFIREKEGTIRMLGALRASRECIRCHRGDEGALLGAFSYTLRPAQYRNPLSGRNTSTVPGGSSSAPPASPQDP